MFSKAPTEYCVQGFVTAYIDLLGLASKLDMLEQYADGMDRNTGLPIIQASIGRIVFLRSLLRKIYNEWQLPNEENPQVQGLTEEQTETFRAAMTHNTSIYWFSDCCTISVPYPPNAVEQMLNGILRMSYALSFASITMLAQKQSVRGGLEIGYGAILEEGEVLGSCLSKAYREETKTTMPRIAIGADLFQILNEPVEKLVDSKRAAPAAWMRKQILSMIEICPEDNQHFIGFLSDSAMSQYRKLPNCDVLIRAASEFIAEMLNDCTVTDHIRRKYIWLQTYFERHGCWHSESTV